MQEKKLTSTTVKLKNNCLQITIRQNDYKLKTKYKIARSREIYVNKIKPELCDMSVNINYLMETKAFSQ